MLKSPSPCTAYYAGITEHETLQLSALVATHLGYIRFEATQSNKESVSEASVQDHFLRCLALATRSPARTGISVAFPDGCKDSASPLVPAPLQF